MGGATGFEEEQKADTDWGSIPEDNPFQPKPRPEQLPALPDVDKKPQLGEHSGSQPGKKQADESELDWRGYVKPTDPGNALGSLNLDQGSEPEAPNTNQSRMDPGIRNQAWNAYQEKTGDAANMRDTVAPDFAAFMDGAKNPDLIALGFTVPNGFKGDATSFADKQNVSGGTSLGSLFNKQGGANLLVDDHEGIANAQTARGTGAAKPQHDATVSADHKLKSKLLTFKSTEEGVREGFHKIEAAQDEIEKVQLSKEVSEDKEALEEAKGHAEDVKGTVEFVFGGMLKYLVAGPEEAVDMMESIGTMASYAVGKVSGHAIERAEAKLKADTAKLQGVEAKQAVAHFEEAKSFMRRSVQAMKAAREAVLAELGERKASYETAGNASAQASGGSSATQAKITALMAGLPAVEAMTGLIKGMVSKTAHKTPYESMAGMGFHMAVHARRGQATNFVTALGQMQFTHQKFKGLETEWENRLRSLQKVREQLGGVRPENDEDLEKSVLGGAKNPSKSTGGGE